MRYKDSVWVPSGVFWNIGSTLQFFSPMSMNINVYRARKSSSGTVSEDSLIGTAQQQANLPKQFTLGFSIDRPNRWMLGVEGSIANWTNFNYNIFGQNDTYGLAWNMAVGGEYRPVTRRQWKAATYRAGFNFAMLPYIVSGYRLFDVSGSLGLSLPVGVRGATGATFPKINFALVGGQRGTMSPDMVKELYVRLHVSILITDKWFIKRRIQ
jgi:hypothetical protein